MKKILMGATAATLLLASCAQNELLDGVVATPNDGKIYFSATSGVPTNTRAAEGNPFVTTGDLQNLGAFHVVGYLGSTEVVGTSGSPQKVEWKGVSWEYDNEPYWPAGTMNFYAYANWETAPTVASTGITAAVTIGQDTYTHKDLLVAATSASKQVRTLLNFKHALTQVVFKAGNINPSKVQATFSDIEIHNIGSKGNMSYTVGGDVTWNSVVTPEDYIVNGITSYTVTDLSATPTDYKLFPRVQSAAEPNNNALMLVPQTFSAWDTNSGVAATTSNDAFIKVTGLLYDPSKIIDDGTIATAKTNYDNAVNAAAKQAVLDGINAFIFCGKFTGTETTIAELSHGSIYIPVASVAGEMAEWKPGKRINYIITIGDSDSGSGGGGYDEEGEPILVPIRFRAVVEDWVEVDVPLLTATFEATSNVVDGPFVAGYVNQLLNDIVSSPAPKVFKGKIKINGNVSSTATEFHTLNGVNFEKNINTINSTQLLVQMNSKFRPGSTIELDFSGIDNWNSKSLTLEVPAGWKATQGGTDYAATAKITITDEATKDLVKLTKLAVSSSTETGLDKTAGLYHYLSTVPNIGSHLAAIAYNENGVSPSHKFFRYIQVNGPVTADTKTFASDFLASMTGSDYDGSEITIDLERVTYGNSAPTDKLETIVPTGWIANLVLNTTGNTASSPAIATTFYASETVSIAEGYDLKFTKSSSTGVAGITWMNAAQLTTALAAAKNGDVFYYNNVDYNVGINFAAAPFATVASLAAAGNTVKVVMRYAVTDAAAPAANNWTYAAGTATYTKQ